MERNLLNERFITIEKLADGELSHKLPGLTVKFSFAETFLGEVLVASTPQGVCYMAFVVRGRDMAESEMMRSEERRVGKECRSRWSPYH